MAGPFGDMRPDILRTIGKRGPESSAVREHNIVGDLGHMPQDMVDYRIQSDSRGVTIRYRSIREEAIACGEAIGPADKGEQTRGRGHGA
jgi:hypothetical protein